MGPHAGCGDYIHRQKHQDNEWPQSCLAMPKSYTNAVTYTENVLHVKPSDNRLMLNLWYKVHQIP